MDGWMLAGTIGGLSALLTSLIWWKFLVNGRVRRRLLEHNQKIDDFREELIDKPDVIALVEEAVDEIVSLADSNSYASWDSLSQDHWIHKVLVLSAARDIDFALKLYENIRFRCEDRGVEIRKEKLGRFDCIGYRQEPNVEDLVEYLGTRTFTLRSILRCTVPDEHVRFTVDTTLLSNAIYLHVEPKEVSNFSFGPRVRVRVGDRWIMKGDAQAIYWMKIDTVPEVLGIGDDADQRSDVSPDESEELEQSWLITKIPWDAKISFELIEEEVKEEAA